MPIVTGPPELAAPPLWPAVFASLTQAVVVSVRAAAAAVPMILVMDLMVPLRVWASGGRGAAAGRSVDRA
jgi:hypothetical protein